MQYLYLIKFFKSQTFVVLNKCQRKFMRRMSFVKTIHLTVINFMLAIPSNKKLLGKNNLFYLQLSYCTFNCTQSFNGGEMP